MVKSLFFVVALLLSSSSLFAQQQQPANGGGASQPYNSPDSAEFLNNEKARELEKFVDEAAIKNAKAARPYVASLLKDAQSGIMDDKLDKTEKALKKLQEVPTLTKYEQSRVHLMEYWYAGKRGNKEMENEAAEKLISLGAGYIDPEPFVEAGMRLLKRQYNGQDYGGAIETLGNLRKEPQSIIELGAIGSVVKKLDDIAAQETDIAVKIRLNDAGNWKTKLLKPNFLFAEINGEIKTIEFNCTNKQTTLPYKLDSVFSTPEAWGDCKIKANGTASTDFKFVQLQKKPS